MPSWQHCITWQRCQGRVVFSGRTGLALNPASLCRKISTLYLDSFLPMNVLPMLDANRTGCKMLQILLDTRLHSVYNSYGYAVVAE